MVQRIPARVRQATVIVLRVVIAVVFAAAALPKIADPVQFARDIANYRLLPDGMVGLVAVVLPMIEIVVAAALLSGVHAAGAAVVAAGLLLGFVAAMGQALARGIDLDCGCFGGAIESRVSYLTIARNFLLTLLCVPIALARRRGLLSSPEASVPTSEPRG
jgi:uncharacterized membrane protein YphA (DoxX/SURF4 family)